MPPSADAYKAIYPKTFLRTGRDDLVDLDSPGWLPYTEICGNSILTWTTFLNLLPIVYCGGDWFVALRTTLVHATGDECQHTFFDYQPTVTNYELWPV